MTFKPDRDDRPAGPGCWVCAGCGRLAGYAPESDGGQETKSPAGAESGPTTPPEAWLYASKRLDLLTLPPSPLLGPTITLGDVTYYRATPAVLRWLLAAGDALHARLGRQHLAGEIGFPESVRQARAYAAGVEAVRTFVERTWPKEHTEAELAKPGAPALPDHGRVPDW